MLDARIQAQIGVLMRLSIEAIDGIRQEFMQAPGHALDVMDFVDTVGRCGGAFSLLFLFLLAFTQTRVVLCASIRCTVFSINGRHINGTSDFKVENDADALVEIFKTVGFARIFPPNRRSCERVAHVFSPISS